MGQALSFVKWSMYMAPPHRHFLIVSLTQIKLKLNEMIIYYTESLNRPYPSTVKISRTVPTPEVAKLLDELLNVLYSGNGGGDARQEKTTEVKQC